VPSSTWRRERSASWMYARRTQTIISVASKYVKPADSIPSTDMPSAVQTFDLFCFPADRAHHVLAATPICGFHRTGRDTSKESGHYLSEI